MEVYRLEWLHVAQRELYYADGFLVFAPIRLVLVIESNGEVSLQIAFNNNHALFHRQRLFPLTPVLPCFVVNVVRLDS